MTGLTHFRASILRFLTGGAALAAVAAWAAAADLPSQTHNAQRDLIRATYAAPPRLPTSTNSLMKAVEKVESLRLEPKPDPTSTPAGEAPPVAEKPATTPAQTPAKEVIVGPVLSPEAIEQMKKLPPERLANPLALADSLYLGGRPAEAYFFYEKALVATEDPETKAWTVFQMANCLKPTDPESAAKLYRRLATEFPKSHWAPVGAAQERLLQWYQTTRPDALTGTAEKKVGGS